MPPATRPHRFRPGDRKLDVVRPLLDEAAGLRWEGIVVIGVAQEIQRVTIGADERRSPDTGCPRYSFRKVDRRVTVYYFLRVGPAVGSVLHQDLRVLPGPLEAVGERP